MDAKKVKGIILGTLRYLFLILIAFIMIFPFWWSIMCSFLPDKEIYSIGLRLIPQFSKLTLANYREVFQMLEVFKYLGNTIIVTVNNVIGTLVFAYLTSYAIEVIRFRGSKILFTILLASMMIPGSITSVATYKLMDTLGLLNTLGSLMVPGMLSIGCVLFLRSFLIDMGREVRESAQLDGANELTICLVLYAPPIAPALICQGVFGILGNWNNYFAPLLYIMDENKYVLALALWQKQAVLKQFGAVLGSSMLLTLPMIVVFIFAQKYFMTGIKISGAKE